MLAITRRPGEAVHVSVNFDSVFSEFCQKKGVSLQSVSLADFLAYEEDVAMNFTTDKTGSKILLGFNDTKKRFRIVREEIVAPDKKIPIPSIEK